MKLGTLLMAAVGWRKVVATPEQCTDDQLERLLHYAEQSKHEMELFIAAIRREQIKRSSRVQARHFWKALRHG